MKKTIFTALLALVALTGQSQVKCHIEGELNDTTQGKTVIICRCDVDIRLSENYITVEADDRWHFSCDVEDKEMYLYNVFLEEQWKNGRWYTGDFLIENGATVKLRFDDEKWKAVSGGPEQMLKVKMDEEAEQLYLAKMQKLLNQKETEIRSRVEEMRAQGKKPQEDTLLMKRAIEISDQSEKLFFEWRAWEREYYAAHPMQYALYEMAHSMQFGKSKLTAELPELYHKAYENFHPENPIHNTIRTMEASWLLQPGNPYIDFEVRTIEGEKVQAADFYKGKVALIDFWASWCSPCRQHSINLIPIYEKYKDLGFTVVAIAHEDKVSSMTKAAKKDGYPWPTNLIDLKDELKVWQKNGLGFSGGGMYLVDRDGTILSTSTDIDELEPLIRKALGLPELAPSDWKAEAEQNRVEKDPEKPFTDFSVVYQGKTTRLSDYVGRGQYVLVDFWASWCAPCLKEIPKFILAYNKYKDKGLQVVGVAVSDKPANTERAMKTEGINYPQIINAQDIAKKAYGISSIPETILFAPDGTIVARGLRGEDIEKKLAEIFE